ncbi:hypothetical protein R3P38DRAFT_3176514 [Favolaschia claudopus]|uniref:Uncharacterized protein n=1 Tax=Favolaschia claudopus TaxID=2862362 RepID=A0AAW0D8V7_9AGAR
MKLGAETRLPSSFLLPLLQLTSPAQPPPPQPCSRCLGDESRCRERASGFTFFFVLALINPHLQTLCPAAVNVSAPDVTNCRPQTPLPPTKFPDFDIRLPVVLTWTTRHMKPSSLPYTTTPSTPPTRRNSLTYRTLGPRCAVCAAGIDMCVLAEKYINPPCLHVSLPQTALILTFRHIELLGASQPEVHRHVEGRNMAKTSKSAFVGVGT